jgi:hypothetical protein
MKLYHLRDNAWANHLMIQVVANVLDMSIEVYMFDIDGLFEDERINIDPDQDFIQDQGGAICNLVIGNINNLHFVTQEFITAETQFNEEDNMILLSNDSPDSLELMGLASAVS